MKRTSKFTLAASMLALTLAAVPQNASAAVDTYLVIDGRPGNATTAQSIIPWVCIALSLVG